MSIQDSQDFFEEIDFYFAKRLLVAFPDASEDLHVFLSVLMAFSRQGHVCINILHDHLEPSLDSFISDPFKRVEIEKKAISGASALPFELVEEIGTNVVLSKRKPICRFKTFYYLQRNWEFETCFIHQVQKLKTDSSSCLGIKEECQVISNVALNIEQNHALQLALNHSFTLITGGPGTGKTYTATHIVAEYLNSLPSEKREKAKVCLAAPTGKAAAHLKKNLLKHFTGGHFFCGTVHRLLNLRGKKDFFDERVQLFADLVLIDECSMIDAHLFSILFSALRQGTKIILMGDKNQLPPVETGSFFADLVELSKQGLPIACAELKACMRSDKQPLLDMAHSVQNGDVEEAMRHIASFKKDQLNLLQKNRQEEYQKLWESVKGSFIFTKEELESPFLLLHKMDKFRILSSLRKGPFGVEALNDFIAHKVYEEANQKAIFPILLTRSDRSLNLSNGESGVLVCQRTSFLNKIFEKEDMAIFWDEEGEVRKIPAAILPSYEYAFCLSVHKSQGSEFDEVLLLIPPGTEAFGREVLYTAITRARQKLHIEGEDSILRQAIMRSSRKVSGLKERIKMHMMKN